MQRDDLFRLFFAVVAVVGILLSVYLLQGLRAFVYGFGSILLGSTLGLSQVCYFAAISYSGVTVATLVTLCTSPILVIDLGRRRMFSKWVNGGIPSSLVIAALTNSLKFPIVCSTIGSCSFKLRP